MKIDVIGRKKVTNKKQKQLNRQLDTNAIGVNDIIYNNKNNNNQYKFLICFLYINI